jgi:hypothetical protein
MPDAKADHWISEMRRRDGVRIELHPSDPERFQIATPNGATLDTCPCCGKGLPSRRAARLVADEVYPVVPLEDRAISIDFSRVKATLRCDQCGELIPDCECRMRAS